MKDVSDGIIECTSDAENTPLPDLSDLDNVCLDEKPVRSSTRCEECEASRVFSNTWGDFEGFNEFTPQSEQFYYADEALPLDSFTTSTSDGGHCTELTKVQDEWDAFHEEDDENTQDCVQIFKMSFPVPSVEETSEDVKSLDTLLASTSNGENVMSQLLKSHLWLDNDRSDSGKPGCDWKNSKGCRDLMSLLCISAKNTPVNNNEAVEDLTDSDVEQINETLKTNKSLIQTKLDVAPGCKHGHIFSYQLFLKKPPADVPMSFLPFSGKKSFFSTNQVHFNF